ncbi:Protein ApaG [Rhynchospora pubera]|uniref:Protein ApaG n=1 Tax=Rhynchospora pubera TaxID=906938 RepID=A0AAV8EGH4_9POAL|nr:Protein ApaG [Rhynchospora pubera]
MNLDFLTKMKTAAVASPSPISSFSCRNWNGNGILRMRSPMFVIRSATATPTRLNSNSNSNSNSETDETREEDQKRLSRSAASSSAFTFTYSLLKQQLAVATKFEDYKEAARLRDSLQTFEDEEPVLRLRKLLRKAVQEERFQDAAKYRDELKEVAPHALLKCSSDATTLGIRVQVRSVYVESRSRPLEGQFFYAYRIRISNNSTRTVQLLRRHWIVNDGWGRVEHVWGTGVVGQQPVIPPGAAFEYSSACPLSTPSGRMEGDFEMKPLLHSNSDSDHRNGEIQNNNKKKMNMSTGTFNVAIAPFSLSVFGDDLSTSSSTFLY